MKKPIRNSIGESGDKTSTESRETTVENPSLTMERVLRRLQEPLVGATGDEDSDSAITAIQRLLEDVPDPVIFDVGAHYGHMANIFRDLFPSATIYAFEPFLESFGQLQANTGPDPGIHTFNFGLSNKQGMYRLDTNPHPETNSLFATDERGPQTWGEDLPDTKDDVQSQIDAIFTGRGVKRFDPV